MPFDLREIVTPGFNPGVHLQGVMDGQVSEDALRAFVSRDS